MMKVRELIELLSKMNPERLVVLQKDAEGNGYSPLSGADDNARYLARCTWDGEVMRETLSDEDRAAGFGDDDVTTEGEPACVLYPVN